jgi:hypothetical protein
MAVIKLYLFEVRITYRPTGSMAQSYTCNIAAIDNRTARRIGVNAAVENWAVNKKHIIKSSAYQVGNQEMWGAAQ